MRKYDLGFISDELIFDHVKNTIEQYRCAIDLASFNKNIIDPIKLTFDAKVYGQTLEQAIEAECIRQIDKSNNNVIGYFHQHLFRIVGDGWEVPKAGFDIINNDRHIYVVLKDKCCTMSASQAAKTYIVMQDQLLRDSKATCLLVEIFAEQSQNQKWTPPTPRVPYSHERIRHVSIDFFYELVFGDPLAFLKLCQKLPLIIDDVLAVDSKKKIHTTINQELAQISPDLSKSIFQLAFRNYEGFERF